MTFQGWPDLGHYAWDAALYREARVEVDWLNSWSRQYHPVKEQRNKHYKAYSSWGALYEWE